MQHFETMKGLNATGGLLHNFPHLFERRLWVITHPLVESLPFNELRCDINEVANPVGWPGAHDVRAVDSSGDPVLQQEAFKVSRVVA